MALNSISDTFTIVLDRNVADLIYFLKFNVSTVSFCSSHIGRGDNWALRINKHRQSSYIVVDISEFLCFQINIFSVSTIVFKIVHRIIDKKHTIFFEFECTKQCHFPPYILQLQKRTKESFIFLNTTTKKTSILVTNHSLNLIKFKSKKQIPLSSPTSKELQRPKNRLLTSISLDLLILIKKNINSTPLVFNFPPTFPLPFSSLQQHHPPKEPTRRIRSTLLQEIDPLGRKPETPPSYSRILPAPR